MGENSKIEWTDATWNPTRGCTKISQGCKNCYAETFAERWRGIHGHPYEQGFDPRTAPDQLTLPLKWKKPRRIFVDSMSDLFHEAFPFEYIAAVFGVMAACADREMGHTFQLLTKRPSRAVEFFQWLTGTREDAPLLADGRHRVKSLLHESVKAVLGYHHPGRPAVNLLRGWPLQNVWIGTSISTQPDADKNILWLLEIPAAVHFVSAEPLLAGVDLRNIYLHHSEDALDPNVILDALTGHVAGPDDMLGSHVDWVIVGGESGPDARPLESPGRWPANVVLDEEAAVVLDAQTGQLQPGASPAKRSLGSSRTYGDGQRSGVQKDRTQLDSGGASRFFYSAKAGADERNDGLDLPNHHPTVKPVSLMRWLVRLVTPPGGVVLDPFMGSGSTGVAAIAEGFDFIGIDREPEYVEMSRRRLSAVAPMFASEIPPTTTEGAA